MIATVHAPHEALTLCAIVAAYAIVQSVFGVGLLVFGTPTLLLLGFPFEEVLAYLLPCSIVISALQVYAGGLSLEPIRREFIRYAAPAVLLGTVVVLVVLNHKLNIRAGVGVMLVLTAVLRLVQPIRLRMGVLIRKRLRLFLAGLGILHGLSNLGGGVLTVIVSSLYSDKRSIRKHVAFAYGLMGLIQFSTLLATTGVGWHVLRLALVLAAIAALTYQFVGRRVFDAADDLVYQGSLTALIAAFGVLLLMPT